MKLTIIYETKKLNITLNSPIRVKDLIYELTKKLILQKNDKICLFNTILNSCYDDSDFISNSDDLEILLYTIKTYKSQVLIKTKKRIEDLIKICTNAKDVIKINKPYRNYKGYATKNFMNRPADSEFDYFKDLILSSTSQNSSIRSKISELMYKFETLKDLKEGIVNDQNTQNQTLEAAHKKENIISASNNASSNNTSNSTNPSTNPFEKFFGIGLKTQTEINNIDNKADILENNPFKHASFYKKPTEPEKIEANKEKLENLICMGFEEDRCKKALIISRNNIEHATELLLGGSDFELYDQVNSVNTMLNPLNTYDMPQVDKYNIQANINSNSASTYDISNVISGNAYGNVANKEVEKPSNYNYLNFIRN